MKNRNSTQSIPALAIARMMGGVITPLETWARQRSIHVTGPRNGTIDRIVTRTATTTITPPAKP